MKRFFYLYSGVLFLVLQATATQGQFLVSGDARQPHICMPQIASGTGMAGDSVKPCLYLLSGNTAAEFPVAGTYSTTGNAVCYQPMYPLAQGQRFLLRAAGSRDTVISVPERIVPDMAATAVAGIYPLSDSIPENILFFHVRFTQAMEEDREAWKKIAVKDDQGKVIPATWRQRSFWLDSGRLLVLMIHPGRVKTGIRYTGPVFTTGRKYSICVDSTMPDAWGRPLGRAAIHEYTIIKEQKKMLQACEVPHKLDAGTREPLLLRFCNGVDHAAACTGILMYDVAGKRIACTVQQYEECTVSVQPHDPWPRGKLQLELSGVLYDCAGNRMSRLFEIKRIKAYRKDRRSQFFPVSSR